MPKQAMLVLKFISFISLSKIRFSVKQFYKFENLYWPNVRLYFIETERVRTKSTDREQTDRVGRR